MVWYLRKPICTIRLFNPHTIYKSPKEKPKINKLRKPIGKNKKTKQKQENLIPLMVSGSVRSDPEEALYILSAALFCRISSN